MVQMLGAPSEVRRQAKRVRNTRTGERDPTTVHEHTESRARQRRWTIFTNPSIKSNEISQLHNHSTEEKSVNGVIYPRYWQSKQKFC
jgi:hypothetical protein